MLGWLSEASTWASRRNRAIRSPSSVNASGRIFSATSRLSFVSRARYTSPMPPAPMADRISYAPRRVPDESGMALLHRHALLQLFEPVEHYVDLRRRRHVTLAGVHHGKKSIVGRDVEVRRRIRAAGYERPGEVDRVSKRKRRLRRDLQHRHPRAPL